MLWKIRAVYLHSEAHQWFFISSSVNFKNCTLDILFMTWSIFKSLLWIIFPFPLVWLHVFRWFSFLGEVTLCLYKLLLWKYHSPSRSESCSLSETNKCMHYSCSPWDHECDLSVLLFLRKLSRKYPASSLIFRFYYKADNILC